TWFIAEEGWLIRSILFKARFSAGAKRSVRLWFRDSNAFHYRWVPDSDGNFLVFIRPEGNGATPRGSYRIDLPRGMRSVAFNKMLQGSQLTELLFEFELVKESQTGSLVFEGLDSKMYTLQFSRFWIDGQYARRADRFPDGGHGGWLPGRHKFWIRHTAETMPGSIYSPKDFDIKIEPGESYHHKLSMSYDYDFMLGQHGRAIGRIALSADYPAFIVGPSFDHKLWTVKANST
ncbi:unnamed protein product, partial [marine sediment metagenome]